MGHREKSGSQYKQTGQTILPIQVPDLIKSMIPIACKVNLELFRKVLKVVLKDIQGGSISEDIFSNLQASFTLDEDKFVTLYAGVLLLMKHILRYPATSIKKELLCNELTELRIPANFIEDICAIVFGERRQSIDALQSNKRVRSPSLTSFKWRVDVTISTSALNRVLEPTILMEMENSDGKTSTFEVTQSKFHELRYNVAYLLKEMEDVEKKTAST